MTVGVDVGGIVCVAVGVRVGVGDGVGLRVLVGVSVDVGDGVTVHVVGATVAGRVATSVGVSGRATAAGERERHRTPAKTIPTPAQSASAW